MIVESIFQLGSGLGLFILGMKAVKDSFYQIVSGRLEAVFNILTINLPAGLITGLVVTMLIQSSSATTVIIISLVNAGLLSFRQAQGVVMGANIGTTATVQLFSFSLEDSAGLIILVGLILYSSYYFTGLKYLQYIARGVIGFGILFFGLDVLGGLVNQWREADFFLRTVSNLSAIPILGIISGGLITAIIQSSSALTGIVVVLAKENLLDLLGAVALAVGSNVGTCITAFIAGINSSPAAKKVVWFHFFFNLAGVIVLGPILPHFVKLVSLTAEKLARQVANAHTIFNLVNTGLFIMGLQIYCWKQGGTEWD